MYKRFATNIIDLLRGFLDDCYEGRINDEYLENFLSEILENEDIPRKIEERTISFIGQIREEGRNCEFSDWDWLLNLQDKIQDFIDIVISDISYYNDNEFDNDDLNFVLEKDLKHVIQDIDNLPNEEFELLPSNLQKEKIDWSGRICDFVKNFQGMATEQAIKKEFIHLPKAAIHKATIETPIVNMNGYYRHIDQLGITCSEKEQWKIVLDELLLNNNVYHFKELSDRLKERLSSIFVRIGVHDYLQMYYISAKLFSQDFYFMRPYVSRQVINNESKSETALNKLMEGKFFLVNDIKEYLRKYFFNKIEYHEFLESRDDIIFLGEGKYTFIDNLDLSHDIAFDRLDDCLDSIFDETKGYCDLKKFQCYEELPNIGYEWNEWLLHSIIPLYSEKYSSKAIGDSFGKVHLYAVEKNDSKQEIIFDALEEFDVDAFIEDMSLDELEEYLQ